MDVVKWYPPNENWYLWGSHTIEVRLHNDKDINPPNSRAITYDVLNVGLGDIGKIKQQTAKKRKSIVQEIDYSKLPKIPPLGTAAFEEWFSPFFDHAKIFDDGSEDEGDAQPSKKGKSSSKGGKKK
ncbi:hypothetical protein KSP40_PGU008692 [Platanthera guangdongensis]|uniref:Uncharacterized protein n=1 Tax=Platanthera guangdongensis TaxID=2320717 RepID=A0ABR2MBF2_9ASPA